MCPHPRCQGMSRASIGAGVQRGDRPMAGPEHTPQRLSNRRGVWMLGNQTGKYPPRGRMAARRFRKRTQGCSWKAPSPEDPTLNCVKVAKARAQFLWVSAWDAQPPSLMAEACASLKSWDKHGPVESFRDSRLLLLLSMETTFPVHRHGYVSTKPRSLSSWAQSQNAFFQSLCIKVRTSYSSGLHFQAWTQEGCLIPSPLSCVHLQGSEGANINESLDGRSPGPWVIPWKRPPRGPMSLAVDTARGRN